MVKVAKVTAYEIGDKIYTNRIEAEQAVREQVLIELLDAHMAPGGTPQDVAKVLTRNWDGIKRRMDEAFRGIS